MVESYQYRERGRGQKRDVLRMLQWLILAAACYVIVFGPWDLQDTNPGLQSSVYYVAQITLRAYLGYWIARSVLGRIRDDGTDAPYALIARAVIVAGVILTSK